MKAMLKRILSMVIIVTLLLNGCGTKGGKVSDLDEAIVGQVVGGFFYSSESILSNKEGEAFVDIRREGADLLRAKLLESLLSSQELSNGYDQYETFLKDELDKQSLKENDLLTVQIILNQMIAYRAAIEANEALIIRYSESNPSNETEEAVLNCYIMESGYQLYTLHTEFVDLMTMNTAKVVSMFESDEGDGEGGVAQLMYAAYEQLVTNQILPLFTEYLYVYKEVAVITNHIASADYYVEESHLKETLEVLEKTKDSETVQLIKEACETRLNSRDVPSYLVEVSNNPIELDRKTSRWDSLFMESVHADDLDDYARAIAAVQMIKDIQGKDPKDRDEFYATATANMILNMSKARENLEQFDQKHLANYQDMSPTQMLEAYNNTLKGNDSQAVPATELVEEVQASRDYSKYQETIDLLNKLRSGVDLAGYNPFATNKVDSQFGLMVLALSTGLKKKGGELEPETMQALTQFINRDLGDILGDKKGTLVNLLLDNESKDYIDAYLDWKDKTNNFTDLKFDLADIQATLGQLNLRSEDVAGILHQLVTAYENSDEPGGLQSILNLPQMIIDVIWEILGALSFGIIKREPEVVENGTSSVMSIEGQLDKSSTFVNSVEIEARDYRTKGDEDNIGSYKMTLKDKDGNITEEIMYDKGVKTRHSYYGMFKGNHRMFYTDYYENGEFVNRDHSLNPNLRLDE